MFRSAVYHGNSFLGEVEVYPQDWSPMAREIRISCLSPPSERCPPLAVLHTIASAGLRFRMESQSPATTDSSPLLSLHATCLRENKTAVVPLGEEELHLVAMSSRKNLMQYSCFWGFTVAPQLYNSCLVMLNLRCLGIVFDLDETLIVANTMRSFEDRIDALQKKKVNETDPQRVTGMQAEIRRYQDDKSILKQYIENDQVVEDGKVFKVQSEIVPPLSDGHQPITRPIIRLQEKNIILTRVNPAIRDTSVLVRLRPAWEDLRSYLTARGRKRFEVYVCTMAERDYALEMWRLLDPEAHLINSKELLDRIVCVKSGSRKSLLCVFQDGICHPKMALVIDDRLKVWVETDQPRVHVVPAFVPYYAPQAEANNSVPVLCVARNVACNVRGGFFKEFDEGLLSRVNSVFYEDEMSDFPSAPDVGSYLISDDDTSASNGNRDPLPFEGITNVEAEKRLEGPNFNIQAAPPMVSNLDSRSISSVQHVMSSSSAAVSMAIPQMMMPLPVNPCSQSIALGKPLGQTGFPEPSLQGSPAREEGEVPESELDPDTRRRLLILQHGQDTREPPPPPLPPPPPPPLPFQLRPLLQVSVTPMQSHGGWFPLNEEINQRQLKRTSKEFPLDPEVVHFNKKRSQDSSFFHGGDNIIASDRGLNEKQRYPMEACLGDDQLRSNHTVSNHNSCTGEEMPMGRISSNHRDVHLKSGRAMTKYAETPAGVLQEIAVKCGTKVEYRKALPETIQLQFSVEVWFVGEKIGDGVGSTRKEAQHQAAEKSLQHLANKYLSDALSDPIAVHGDLNKFSHTKENGFINDTDCFGYPTFSRNDRLPVASTSEESRCLDQRLEGSKRSIASVSALKDLCTTEGFTLGFQVQHSPSSCSANKGEVHAQVEVAGQILGKGIGANWEEAKLQAADEALGTLKSMLGQFTQKQSGSPRSPWTTSSKKLKGELSRVPQRSLSSSR